MIGINANASTPCGHQRDASRHQAQADQHVPALIACSFPLRGSAARSPASLGTRLPRLTIAILIPLGGIVRCAQRDAAMTEKPPTFLFADLAGFTALTEAHGDEEAADHAAEFCARIRVLLPKHDAEEVKTIGDAVMVRVTTAERAICLGLEIVDEVRTLTGFPAVHVGMHTGPAVERDGDWFGAAVNLAARVSGAAGGNEVLLSEATREAAGALTAIELNRRGPQWLKNVAEPIVVYRALRSGDRGEAGLIDPVCRMSVEPDNSAGTLTHDGVEYHFCSLECAGTFASDPEHHLREHG